MIALLILVIAGLYLIVSITVVYRAVQFAKRNGRSSWRWGGSAVLVMYLLVFWDHIPVLVLHKYYCGKDAGFWVHKTPEQWIKENSSNVGEPWSDQSKWRVQAMENGETRYWMSSRVYLAIKRKPDYAHAIGREEKQLVDAMTGAPIAQAVDYGRGSISQFAMGLHSWTDAKLWLGLGRRTCGTGEPYMVQLSNFGRRLQKLGEQKKGDEK